MFVQCLLVLQLRGRRARRRRRLGFLLFPRRRRRDRLRLDLRDAPPRRRAQPLPRHGRQAAGRRVAGARRRRRRRDGHFFPVVLLVKREVPERLAEVVEVPERVPGPVRLGALGAVRVGTARPGRCRLAFASARALTRGRVAGGAFAGPAERLLRQGVAQRLHQVEHHDVALETRGELSGLRLERSLERLQAIAGEAPAFLGVKLHPRGASRVPGGVPHHEDRNGVVAARPFAGSCERHPDAILLAFALVEGEVVLVYRLQRCELLLPLRPPRRVGGRAAAHLLLLRHPGAP